MAWTVPLPKDNWKDPDLRVFHREVWTRLKFNTFTWNPPNVPATSTVDTTLTTTDAAVLEGLRVGMAIYVTPPSSLDSGLVCGGAWVATDDTLTIRLGNVTAGGLNPAEGTWAFHGMVQ